MPSMYFDMPKNEIAAPLRDWDRLRAQGNLTYLEFIALVKELWERAHPDIPIHPTRGKQFAVYPCIVYGLESRSTATNESKARHREFKEDENNNVYRIKGQRFLNLVSFTAVTRNEPELAENIMETFELFMGEITPVIKLLGISELIYGRRLSDTDQNRDNDDVCTRAVVYQVFTEHVTQTKEEVLKEIIIQARTFIEEFRNIFTAQAGDDFITVQSHALPNGAEVQVLEPVPEDGGFLPAGLHAGWRYRVLATDGNKIYLETLTGDPVFITEDGVGRLAIWINSPTVNILDEHATPNT